MKPLSKTLLKFFTISLLTFIFGCSPGSSLTDINPGQALEMINKDGEGLLLLDVRTKDEYRAGHIKGSRLIPVQVLSGMTDEIAAYKDKKVIAYCAVGGRSSKAAALLQEKGFREVYNMTGGIQEWVRLGYEIEK